MAETDIAILGSGIACTSTLIEVFRKLIEEESNQHKIAVTVIEKHHEFWLGIPYGSRSSINALTITSIADFFTAEKERHSFLTWFKQNKDELLDWYQENGGLTAEQWLERNGKALEQEDWKNLYLPRYMCGKYQKNRLDNLHARINEKNLAELHLINAEAIDVTPAGNGYEITYEMLDKSISKLTAAKVVIATGSAPVKDVELPIGNDAVTLINNLYEPNVNSNIKKLVAALDDTNKTDKNVFIIGSNASSIEFLYLLAGLPDITNRINKLVVISKSGLLPYHIIDKTLDHYPTDNLDRVKTAGNYSIETLIDAAKKDLNVAVKDGVIVPHIDRIISFTIELLQPLDEDAKKAFLGIYGMQLSNLFRRSGADYKSGAGFLLEMQKLTLLKGAFIDIEPVDNGGKLHYIDTDTQQKTTYPELFNVVINCTGANDLDQSSSRLIYNLVHNDIAKVNLSGKGFYVNEKFEAAPNLYIMGPLLGGNKNERIHFWHLENASRIMYLAPFLAECLLEK